MSFLLQFFNFCRRLLYFRRVGLSLFLVAFAFFSISPLELGPQFFTFTLELALGHPFAQGNLFIVFHPSSGHSTEQNAQMANLNHSLWCQATENSIDRLQIKEAKFVRILPKPETVLPARYNRKNDRAFLDFAPFSASAIGKYRCEITTEDDENVTGNLFVYMRPILVNKIRLDQAEENNSFAWIGPVVKVNEGDEAILTCEVAGYPLPRIQWFKDGEPLNTTAFLPDENDGQYATLKYQLIAQSLHILRVDQNDEGNYKCVATNSFPLHVDEKYNKFQVTFEQNLQMTTKLSWLLPLLIIIFGLIILGFIILGCSRWKQYNVAQNERELGKKGVADGQKLRLDHDDVED